MLPFHKAQWFLGYSNLAMMLEQDRRHWLLKTHKKVYEQTNSGATFKGIIDNTGSTIIAESTKLPKTIEAIKNATFTTSAVGSVFSVEESTLPFSYDVNGLAMARIVSNYYPYNSTYKTYKVRFDDCSIVYIPFKGSENSNDVFGFQFIKTSTPPTILMPDNNDQYTIEVVASFSNMGTVEYYYPLDTFHPVDITDLGGGSYETTPINSEDFIGYPIFWFISSEVKRGPTAVLLPAQYMHYGNATDNKYTPYVYFSLPDCGLINLSDYKLIAHTTGLFTNEESDFFIDIESLSILNEDTSEEIPLTMYYDSTTSETNAIYRMVRNVGWTYETDSMYSVSLDAFISNYNNQRALIPALTMQLDTSRKFVTETRDTGAAGIQAFTDNNAFPYDFNNFEGLPGWFSTSTDNDTMQRLFVYAMHNSNQTIEGKPETSQVAGLILDPGRVTRDITVPENDKRGRVYILSNDEVKYENNAASENPKPDRTAARICDIPTSLVQLSNISGIAPSPIVDKKYIRSQASFDEASQYRLYNTLADFWVKPTHLMKNAGVPVYENMPFENNEFVFQTLDGLNAVDLNVFNDFREWTNLNRAVSHEDISVYAITNPGSGYIIDEVGTIIVGGYSLNYIVSAVDDSGGVTEVSVYGEDDIDINLANFDIISNTSGITAPYGTSSTRGENPGTGLEVELRIANYADLLPTKGDIRKGLYAFARVSNGLWLYKYNTTSNKWEQSVLVSEYEESNSRNLSTQDSFIESVLPNMKSISVAPYSANTEVAIKTISSATSINVIDDTATPVILPESSTEHYDRTIVDINKFHCDYIGTATATSRTVASVFAKMKEIKINHYDSFIIWRFENSTSKTFQYGVIKRSLNNYISYDTNSNLPVNQLDNPYYVHTNPSTTITWNIPLVGPMVWTFNPKTNKKEMYQVDPTSRSLQITRTPLLWTNIEVYTNNFQTHIDLVDDNGRSLWNIISSVGYLEQYQDPIYKHPTYNYNHPLVSVGDDLTNVELPEIIGMWQLIYPRVQTFRFANADNSVTYTPVRMNLIRGTEVSSDTVVVDSDDHNVNYNTCIINDTGVDTELKIYNEDNGHWISI